MVGPAGGWRLRTLPGQVEAAVSERPILFTAPMIRALLAGTKTQTRRAVKLPKWMAAQGGDLNAATTFRDPGFGDGEYLHVRLNDESQQRVYCPYADTPGDRLWVREAFRFLDSFDGDSPSTVGTRCLVAGYPKPWAPTHYEADGCRDNWMNVGTVPGSITAGKLRPGIHMPRWASRILLEMVTVRVERLQDISEADAIAEGITEGTGDFAGCFFSGGPAMSGTTAKECYARLWDEINGAGSWAANPWVWCLTFRMIKP
jgi:hypothetical protein